MKTAVRFDEKERCWYVELSDQQARDAANHAKYSYQTVGGVGVVWSGSGSKTEAEDIEREVKAAHCQLQVPIPDPGG